MGSSALVVAWCAVLILPHCFAQGDGFHFCSRIISVREGATLLGQADLGFKADDPVGCINQEEPKDIKNGVFAGACKDSVVDLKPGLSSFARTIALQDRSGTLRAFTTKLTTKDGRTGQSVCFRHDVPMGGGDLADDSPRCFGFGGHPFLMFIAQTCPSGICTTHWLTAAVGKCDGMQISRPVGKKEEAHQPSQATEQTAPGSQTQSEPAPPSKPIDLSGVPLPPLAG